MGNVDGQSAVKIGGVIDSLLGDKEVKERYRLLAIDIMYNDSICVNKKKEQIKELGKQQEQELNESI